MANLIFNESLDLSSQTCPQIEFGQTPDLRDIVAANLGRSDDIRSFGKTCISVIGLSNWDQLSTQEKVWAITWRVFAAILILTALAASFKFLGPLVGGLICIVLITASLSAAGLAHHRHTQLTLDSTLTDLASKASKVYHSRNHPDKQHNMLNYTQVLNHFEQQFWDRLKAKSLASVSLLSLSKDKREEHFAKDLAQMNMEVVITSVLEELEDDTQIPAQAKMRLAYDVCENLWDRYKNQMMHYPWLENPDMANAPITPKQALDAASKMVYQKMGINAALLAFWNKNIPAGKDIQTLGKEIGRENIDHILQALEPSHNRVEVAEFLKSFDGELIKPNLFSQVKSIKTLEDEIATLDKLANTIEQDDPSKDESDSNIAKKDELARLKGEFQKAIDLYTKDIPNLLRNEA